jgi:hypothetical protein
MHVFMHDLAGGAFTYAPPPLDQLTRAMEIDQRHEDLGLGLVDASVVALAEALGIRRLAMRDLRHFAAVRLLGPPIIFADHSRLVPRYALPIRIPVRKTSAPPRTT